MEDCWTDGGEGQGASPWRLSFLLPHLTGPTFGRFEDLVLH